MYLVHQIHRAIASSVLPPATSRPRFSLGQQVQFCGGTGIIIGYRPVARTWTYAIEMELGPTPSMGRIGPEATVLLQEAELQETRLQDAKLQECPA
jgi:hypothetical protein